MEFLKGWSVAALLVVLLSVTPSRVSAQSAPRIMTGCFLIERVDGETLPLPKPFEILLVPRSGRPEATPEAVTKLPAVAQAVSPRQVRGTWMDRTGIRSAFFEFSVYQDRLRGTIWLAEEDIGHEVYATPTPCPEPPPPA